ncbi:MAG TPA: amidohydrolase family protein [Bacteroidales bacterium]|nr:amidohydrolase family protein [Bacteroidales bacterium]
MRRISAQYVITNSGPPLKRAIISFNDKGTITGIEDTGGKLAESRSVEFYNGIIIPGFVNCHCHLELSHLRNRIKRGGGLGNFVEQVRSIRERNSEAIKGAAAEADKNMYYAGINLCADICNTADTFEVKKDSKIEYINFLEVFGIDQEKAQRRMDEITEVADKANKEGLPYYLVPHAAYSMSGKLFRLLRNRTQNNKLTSIHFMESPDESDFLKDHSGNLITSYERSGLLPGKISTSKSHSAIINDEVTRSGNLILVHNTFADRDTVRKVLERGNTWWCLCPGSNSYIENAMPPAEMLLEEGCRIVIGTDSLASNSRLDILSEILLLQQAFPELGIEELIPWATVNGAEALGKDNELGKLEEGKNPGLLLLENVDLINMKLLPGTKVTRLA